MNTNHYSQSYGEKLGYLDWYGKDALFWDILSKLRIDSTSKVAEFGTGSGFFADILIKKYKINPNQMYLSDVSDFRRTAFESPFSVLNMSHDKVSLLDETQDFVFCMHTIEHLENPQHAIKECFRIVKPGGFVILAFPNGWSIFSRLLFLIKAKIYRYHRPKTLHIGFLPKNIFLDCIRDGDTKSILWSRDYLFDQLLNFFCHDYRGRFTWLSKIKISLPRSVWVSSDTCFFLRKK